MDERKSLSIEILHSVDVFRELSYGALERLADSCRERVFRSGETIFAEESTGTSMMVIVSGEVRISHVGPATGVEENLVVLKPGDVFGEMALLEDMPRSATAFANSDIFLLEIERQAFLHFIENDPQSGVHILMTLAQKLSARLREADTKMKAFVNLSQWL